MVNKRREGEKGEIANQIIWGDCYKYLKEIDDNSIDLIVTDPPYLIKNNQNRKKGGQLTNCISNLCEELQEAEITGGIDYSILDDFMRVMKRPNIYIWCNKAQILEYLNYFVGKHKCAFDILVWIKTNPIPLCGKNYLPDKEYCLYFRKGVALNTTYHTGKTYWITQTNVADKKKYHHPTIKPLAIIETLIINSSQPGDMVLDCFLGSGTTAVAALKTGRRYIGIENNVQHRDTVNARINEAKLQLTR